MAGGRPVQPLDLSHEVKTQRQSIIRSRSLPGSVKNLSHFWLSPSTWAHPLS